MTHFTVQEGYLRLSVFCDCRFTNLDHSFEKMMGGIVRRDPQVNRTLRMVSNVAASAFVENRVTNLLREVQYVLFSRYYELLYIQCISVRQNLFDTIKVDLGEENREHAFLEHGKTIVTLHFKQHVQ